MNEQLHPAASHALPSFIATPGEADVFLVAIAVILALSLAMFGILFLRSRLPRNAVAARVAAHDLRALTTGSMSGGAA